jgi:DNA-3-methyladenine glycosylase II
MASLLDKMLGVSVDLTGFYSFADKDPRLKTLYRRFRGAKPPQFPTVFEALLNGISCQQLSLSVGIALLNRIAIRFGALTGKDQHAFPAPREIARATGRDLRALGYSGHKASAILGVARKVTEGRLDLEGLRALEDRDVMETLLAIPGVGPWTSGYVLLRGLGRLSVFPGGDVGALNNLAGYLGLIRPRDDAQLRQILEGWKPYGGLIYFHLLLHRLSIGGLVA